MFFFFGICHDGNNLRENDTSEIEYYSKKILIDYLRRDDNGPHTLKSEEHLHVRITMNNMCQFKKQKIYTIII